MLKKVIVYSALALLTACNMEKEITVPLPEYANQLVSECYLENGKLIRLTVLETSSYFDRPEPLLVPDARVIVSRNGKNDTLFYNPGYDSKSEKLFTHRSKKEINYKTGDVYSIEVKDIRNRKLTASTTILPIVPIDSIEYKFIENGNAYLLIKFFEDGNQQDYYRLIISKLKNGKPEIQSDYQFNDDLRNGKKLAVGTAPRYKVNDTVEVTLYHIEKQYYQYLESAFDARNANGNPFAQPGVVKSAVTGGLGVFTNLAYDRKTIIIKN